MAVVYVRWALALLVGYTIPVIASLAFSLAIGRLAPKMVARHGRIQRGHLLLHGVVWTLSTAAAGYATGYLAASLVPVMCGTVAVFLIAALWSNALEMKKPQGILRLGAMTLGTVVGMTSGCALYLISR